MSSLHHFQASDIAASSVDVYFIQSQLNLPCSNGFQSVVV
jgi:hypothetical protein